MTPPGMTEKSPPLDSEAQNALGKIKPQLAAEQIRVLANQAMEYDARESQLIADEMNLPIDFTDLTEVLELFDPVKLVNEFHYINPKINLQDLLKQPPLEVFEGVVKILTVSDRYNSLK
jgi:hypothetical protein